MTVSTTTNRVSYTGDGVVTVFNFSFRLLQAADLDVYLDGVLKTISTHYTVSIDSSGVGGTVTFLTAPANNVVVLIDRVVDYTQETDLPVEGNLPEATLENALDKLTMMAQQLSSANSRSIVLPATSLKSGLLNNEPTSTLTLIQWDSTNSRFQFVSVAEAVNNALPALGGGNVVGPGTSTDYSIPMWSGTGGLTLRAGSALGLADTVFISNGVGAAPTWQARNWLFKAANIRATARALPTSGALSGTYVHLGDWTSAAALTFSHDTRIYLKGNVTLGHTKTGTVQANHGICSSSYALGVTTGRGGGPGGGEAGFGLRSSLGLGGGAGGGCGGAGGRGGWNGTGTNTGGRPHGDILAGGSGGGAGCGDDGGGSNFGSLGGGGGPTLYLEVDGNITLNETISANGAAGAVGVNAVGGGGGGGAGGIIIIRCTGTLTILTGKKITANGGAGGNEATSGRGGGGGGGGIVDIWTGGTQTLPDGAGTHVTATGGAAGSGTPTTAPAAGSAGTTTLLASTAPISLF